MHRFFVASAADGDTVVLSDPDQLHHMRDVLRLVAGDEVVVSDGEGNEYVCSVGELGGDKAVLAVKTRKREAGSRRTMLTIACAIPKRGKMDEIVDKLTQLGVARIIPMQTSRGVVKLDEETVQARLARWQRLAQAAAQQSQRSAVCVVAGVAGLGEVLSRSADFDVKLILTLAGDRRMLPEVLTGSKAASIIVMVGPEGDFTPDEIRAAADAGFVPVSLGTHVLRVETAALAAAAYVSLSLGL